MLKAKTLLLLILDTAQSCNTTGAQKLFGETKITAQEANPKKGEKVFWGEWIVYNTCVTITTVFMEH